MSEQEYLSLLALVTGAVALVAWTAVAARAWTWNRLNRSRVVRPMVTPVALTIVSLGALATGYGYAQGHLLLPVQLPTDLLTFVGSVGRGALAMAGIYAVLNDEPKPA